MLLTAFIVDLLLIAFGVFHLMSQKEVRGATLGPAIYLIAGLAGLVVIGLAAIAVTFGVGAFVIAFICLFFVGLGLWLFRT